MPERVCILPNAMIAGEQMELLHSFTLLVEDGIITRIGAPEPGVRLVRLDDQLLCPMFMDAHTHVGDSGAKELGLGLPMPQVVTPPDGVKHRFLSQVEPAGHIAMMRHALLEMLHSGIIACGDFREQGVPGARLLDEARQGLPLNVRILARMTEGQQPEALLAEGRELLTFCEGLGVRDVESYPEAVLRQLRDEFPDMIFALHADETRSQFEECQNRHGSSQAAYALPWQPNLAVHLTHTPPSDLRRLADAGVMGVTCPRANLLLGDGMPDLAAWQAAGLAFGLGSDNMMVNAPDMLREMDTAVRLMCGMHEDGTLADPAAALRAATLEGARALKLEQRLGSLEVGKEASFISFDLSRPNWRYSHHWLGTLVHRAATADICAVYIQGRPLADWLGSAP